jgi:hypothetical protein
MEGSGSANSASGLVLVTRNQFPYHIQKEPFLDEGDLTKASIVTDLGGGGGYSIKLTFTDHGMLLLNMYTADNKGRHIIVFSQFPNPHKKHKAKKASEDDDSDLVEQTPGEAPAGDTNSTARESGWLAAVLVREPITDGVFQFTPDATRAEGNRIVRGLRNVIAENKDQ